ncbi:short-chain dehydrogenase oxidoreductase [Moniliophthora roreri]|uniref:Uncharacterized protein n=1 Tax=Moniliophthora roreri TaxID=221103 RepID=A0A0W0EU69_MONRR|nr:short-chain dehydrogenase oxidoreductase [Moniliophthora roreri]
MTSINDSKCILVTGATSGIGRALAVALSQLPSKPKIIGTGRRPDRLAELEAAGIDAIPFELDADKETIVECIQSIIQKYPNLDAVILNAGLQREFDFLNTDINLDNLYSEIKVNYLSVLACITAVLPHFKKLAAEGRPCIIANVTSGLCVVPAVPLCNYSASKAALHSMTMSLQSQFQGTNMHFIEIIPPLVESELHDVEGTTEKLSKFWMPLSQYIPETVQGLQNGEPQISSGPAKVAVKKFEKAKYDLTMKKALPTASAGLSLDKNP